MFFQTLTCYQKIQMIYCYFCNCYQTQRIQVFNLHFKQICQIFFKLDMYNIENNNPKIKMNSCKNEYL